MNAIWKEIADNSKNLHDEVFQKFITVYYCLIMRRDIYDILFFKIYFLKHYYICTRTFTYVTTFVTFKYFLSSLLQKAFIHSQRDKSDAFCGEQLLYKAHNAYIK